MTQNYAQQRYHGETVGLLGTMAKMMVIASQNFKLSGIGIVSFLKHSLNGLPSGTVLTSPTRQMSWKVEKRMLWMHSAHLQKRFPMETENIEHIGFSGEYDPKQEAKKTVAMEAEFGYEYLLLPIGYNEKPLDGEELTVVFPC